MRTVSFLHKRVTSRRRPRVLFLVYHSISSTAADAWGVDPAMFRRQMRLLKRLGYRSLTLHEALDAFEQGRPVRRAVVITFDDGYLDTVSTAAPILDEVGFRATVFTLTSLIGERVPWRVEGDDRSSRLATWAQLRTLQERGWEIGFHSATHADLSTLSYRDLLDEFTAGLRAIETEVATAAASVSIAYPWGRYSDDTLRAAEAAGARSAVAVTRRAYATGESPQFAIPRCPVGRDDSLGDFLTIVATGFRLKGVLPAAVKRLGSRLDRLHPTAPPPGATHDRSPRPPARAAEPYLSGARDLRR